MQQNKNTQKKHKWQYTSTRVYFNRTNETKKLLFFLLFLLHFVSCLMQYCASAVLFAVCVCFVVILLFRYFFFFLYSVHIHSIDILTLFGFSFTQSNRSVYSPNTHFVILYYYVTLFFLLICYMQVNQGKLEINSEIYQHFWYSMILHHSPITPIVIYCNRFVHVIHYLIAFDF